MNTRWRNPLILAAFLAIPAAALAQAPVKTAGGVLVNNAGMTLYTFDKDSPGKSACSGQCIALWPAFAATADAKAGGDWSIITREDGSRQWAHKGKPLYLFVRDTKPGDQTGDGFNKVWHVVKP